jgi:hypothetical protein
MKHLRGKFILAAVALVAMAAMINFTVRADDDDDITTFRARLLDFGEVPPQLTGGTGTFHGTLNPAGNRIDWTLTYTGLTAGALFGHIHFAPRGVNGAVIVFFCNSMAGGGGSRNGGTITTAPATAALFACPDSGAPAHAGTITGFWTAADVQAANGPPPAADQNIVAGNFAGLLRFLRAGLGYCNVHTPKHPGGEIRGQVRARHHDDDDEE